METLLQSRDNDPVRDRISRMIADARVAQTEWQSEPPRTRIKRVGQLRHLLVDARQELADAIQRPNASLAEKFSSEIFPLADACRFVASRGRRLLAPYSASKWNAAWWMGRIAVRSVREPWGVVLILGPSNYPLLLPGVQAVQALAAGNAVLVKPAPGGERCMELLQGLVEKCGIPRSLLSVLDSSVAAAQAALQVGVDKVVLTGSVSTGRHVHAALNESMTPSTMELSGNDAAFVTSQADVPRAADAIAYGLTLNGGATCIAPRRIFVDVAVQSKFEEALVERLDVGKSFQIPTSIFQLVSRLAQEALDSGAKILSGQLPIGEMQADMSACHPLVLSGVDPAMEIAQADIFAPVCSVIGYERMDEAISAYRQCPYRLGASVFGTRNFAEHWANQIDAGCVVINDLIVPTADPRAAFGGRGLSGWGATRGAEGLLEMTQLKTVCIRKGKWLPHLDPQNSQNAELIGQLMQFFHARSLSERFAALRSIAKSQSAAKQDSGKQDSAQAEASKKQ